MKQTPVNLGELCGAELPVISMRAGIPPDSPEANAGEFSRYLAKAPVLYVDGVGATKHVIVLAPFRDGDVESNGIAFLFTQPHTYEGTQVRPNLEAHGLAVALVQTCDQAIDVLARVYGELVEPAIKAWHSQRRAENPTLPPEPVLSRGKRLAWQGEQSA